MLLKEMTFEGWLKERIVIVNWRKMTGHRNKREVELQTYRSLTNKQQGLLTPGDK